MFPSESLLKKNYIYIYAYIYIYSVIFWAIEWLQLDLEMASGTINLYLVS